MFHPRGLVFTARVEPAVGSRFEAVAHRVQGHALVRVSGALAKREVNRFEVLGLGLRLSRTPINEAAPHEGDQDLTFATIVSPLTMPIAPFTTRSDDYLANRYWGVAPFAIEGVGRVKLRLTPVPLSRMPSTAGRGEALERAVRDHRARFALELRRTLRTQWEPFATLVLEAPSDVDQEALRFDPFRTGRGIVPVGFVHAIRRSVYAASQAVRPKRTR